MATHSSILARKISWTESLVGYSPWARKESDTTEATEHAYTVYTNPSSDFLRNKFGGKISFKLAIVTLGDPHVRLLK